MTGSTAGVVDDDGNEASTGVYQKTVEQQSAAAESHLQKQMKKLERFEQRQSPASEVSNLPEFEETLQKNGWTLSWIEKQTMAQGWGSPREWKNDTRMRFLQKEAWSQFQLPEEDVHV